MFLDFPHGHMDLAGGEAAPFRPESRRHVGSFQCACFWLQGPLERSLRPTILLCWLSQRRGEKQLVPCICQSEFISTGVGPEREGFQDRL